MKLVITLAFSVAVIAAACGSTSTYSDRAVQVQQTFDWDLDRSESELDATATAVSAAPPGELTDALTIRIREARARIAEARGGIRALPETAPDSGAAEDLQRQLTEIRAEVTELKQLALGIEAPSAVGR